MSQRSGQREDSAGAPAPDAPRALRNPGDRLDRDWPAYFDAVEGNPARDTLLLALDRFDAEGGPRSGLMIDLGAGSGRDTIIALRRGWRVTAVDGSAEGLTRLGAKAADEPDAPLRLLAVEAKFEEMDLSRIAPQGAPLVNASFSLPFCAPEHFEQVWAQIVATLARAAGEGRPARFAGQLFGDRDSWAGIPGRTHHTRAHAERLFRGFALERFEEVEKDGNDAFGNPKHYHVFHVVARLDRAPAHEHTSGGAR
ncbi:MAG: class I SAM-dependent methyltransferase [Phycisphaerales bacterium]|nr:class I SAM-dependent methyltransferase [Phycisphaerales bacterium]